MSIIETYIKALKSMKHVGVGEGALGALLYEARQLEVDFSQCRHDGSEDDLKDYLDSIDEAFRFARRGQGDLAVVAELLIDYLGMCSEGRICELAEALS